MATQKIIIGQVRGQGVPTGGDTEQVLAKKSANNYDFKWTDPLGGGGNGVVDTFSQLPTSLGADDRKLYFVIDESIFYLWDGSKWAEQQPKSITKSQIDNLF